MYVPGMYVCVTFVFFTDCESCIRPISAIPGCMEAGEYGLTRGTCFVACCLEVVAVAGLLWISWCVRGAAGFRVLFPVFFVERTRPAASMRPPCLIYRRTSTTPRGAFVTRGYIIVCDIDEGINPGNHLLCCRLLHSRPSEDVRTATWYGMTALLQLL